MTVRLIVHLGLHKTGTTSIQQYLTEHPFALHACGALYPATGRHHLATTQHAVLASAFQNDVPLTGVFALARPPDREILAAALREEAEVAGSTTVIVSSEEMSRYGAEDVRLFARTFRNFAIVPVVFLRNFADLVDAYYASSVLYSDDVDPPRAAMVRTDLLAPFAAWAEAAADGRLRVVDFDSSPAGNSIDDFLAVTGLPAGDLPPSSTRPPLNRTIPPYLVTLLREMKQAGASLRHVQGLSMQLESLPLPERQTNLSAPLRADLHRRYVEFYTELRAMPWVSWHGVKDGPPELDETRLCIDDLAGAVLALGRAVAARD